MTIVTISPSRFRPDCWSHRFRSFWTAWLWSHLYLMLYPHRLIVLETVG